MPPVTLLDSPQLDAAARRTARRAGDDINTAQIPTQPPRPHRNGKSAIGLTSNARANDGCEGILRAEYGESCDGWHTTRGVIYLDGGGRTRALTRRGTSAIPSSTVGIIAARVQNRSVNCFQRPIHIPPPTLGQSDIVVIAASSPPLPPARDSGHAIGRPLDEEAAWRGRTRVSTRASSSVRARAGACMTER